MSWLHLFARAAGIGHAELSLDEAGTWGVARRSLGTLLTLPTEFHSQPPLYYVVLHFLMQLNDQPWFLRGFSWFCVLLAIQFILFYFDELTLLARVFLCLILIQGDLTSYLATAVRPYGLATLCTIVSCALLLRTLREPTPQRLWGYGVWTVLMLYSMAFSVATFLVQGLFVVGTCLVQGAQRGWRPTWERRRGLLLVMAAVTVAYVPYLWMAIHYQYRPNATDTLPLVLNLATYQRSLANQFRFPEAMMQALYVLCLFALVVRLKERRPDVLLWPLLIVGQIGFVWFFIVGRSPIGVQGKYLMPAFVALAVLATIGFQQLTARAKPAIWLAVPVALAVLVLPAWRTFHHHFGAPVPQGPFARLHVEMARQPGKKLIFFDTGWEGQHLEYVTRNDPDIEYGTQRGTGWASGGENRLSPTYIVQTIERTAPTTRCYYYYLERPGEVFATAFVPTMKRFGYTELPPLPVTHGRRVPGFCRN